MNVRRHISLIILCLAGCQGSTRLAEHWEVGQLTADGSTVFGSTLEGIRSVGRDGSRGTLLVPYRTSVFEESHYRPGRIAVDDRYVYWTQREAPPGVDGVRRVKKAGGSYESVMKVNNLAQSQPMELQVDDAFVFVLTYGRGQFDNWIADTAGSYEGGSLIRIDKKDLSATELASHVRAGSGLCLDSQFVYWSEGGTFHRTISGLADHVYNMDGKIYRVRKSGGKPELLASGLDNPSELNLARENIRFRSGRHYEKNSWTNDLGYFEISTSGGDAKKIAPYPYFEVNQNRYWLRIEYFGPANPGRRAHYFFEKEDAAGKIARLYSTDDDISAFILDRGEFFWLQGTDYALMKMKAP